MSYEPTPADYKLIFEDHRIGAAILEQMIRVFARPPVTTGGIDAVLQTYDRNGARRVLEYITAQVNRANGVDVNNQTEEL